MSTKEKVFFTALGALLALDAILGLSCKDALTPAEVQSVAQSTADIARCQGEGRKYHSYAAYDCCMIEAGLHEGGCRPDMSPPDFDDAGLDSSDSLDGGQDGD